MGRIEEGVKIDFDDVLIKPQRSTVPTRNFPIDRTFKVHNKTIYGIPIISANMDTTGSFAMCRTLSNLGAFGCLHKHYPVDALVDFYSHQCDTERRLQVFYSLGIKGEDIEKLREVVSKCINDINYICVDVANGYNEKFVDSVKYIRETYPNAILMAGNVVTAEMTQELIIQAGVDIVKVGIGPGSVCETRKVTGVGVPQLSAIMDCADAAHGLGALICADGGCDTTGKINKAFGGGADFVMLGGMLAGCDECDGEWVYHQEWREVGTVPLTGIKWCTTDKKVGLKFHGMSSKEAMDIHNGGMASYRASEGKEIVVPYKGPVKDTFDSIQGAVRSGLTYVGANRLKEFSKRCTFVRVK